MCDISPSGSAISIACTTYPFDETTFSTTSGDGFLTAQKYRMTDLRLYGPSGDHVTHDLEPEGGAFTADGLYFLVNFQDNNGYAIFDVTLGKYIKMAGYDQATTTMDASDKDDMINIASGWGTASTPTWGLIMPDQIASFTVGGTYYFVTANEGDTRDGEDLIGISGDFEGEELRFKDFPAPTCTDGCDDSASGFGRLLTTPYMPSDYAVNACGMNNCHAWALELATGTSSMGAFNCTFYQADYGGKKDATGAAAHDDCDYATMVAMYVDSMDKTGTYAKRPDTGYFPTMNPRGETISSHSVPATSGLITQAFTFPGWFSGVTGVDASITGPESCRALCQAESTCDHWTYEFEWGYHECFLKATHSTGTHCQLCTLPHPTQPQRFATRLLAVLTRRRVPVLRRPSLHSALVGRRMGTLGGLLRSQSVHVAGADYHHSRHDVSARAWLAGWRNLDWRPLDDYLLVERRRDRPPGQGGRHGQRL